MFPSLTLPRKTERVLYNILTKTSTMTLPKGTMLYTASNSEKPKEYEVYFTYNAEDLVEWGYGDYIFEYELCQPVLLYKWYYADLAKAMGYNRQIHGDIDEYEEEYWPYPGILSAGRQAIVNADQAFRRFSLDGHFDGIEGSNTWEPEVFLSEPLKVGRFLGQKTVDVFIFLRLQMTDLYILKLSAPYDRDHASPIGEYLNRPYLVEGTDGFIQSVRVQWTIQPFCAGVMSMNNCYVMEFKGSTPFNENWVLLYLRELKKTLSEVFPDIKMEVTRQLNITKCIM